VDNFKKKENYFNKKLKQTVTELKTEKAIYDKLKENSFQIIKSAFMTAETILSKARFDVNFSGSTSVVVFIIGNHIICANAGDSRAFLVTDSSIFLLN
jgi:serine/threonine protein phosphatase PrpC